ncbi:MAG: hypothetical protein UR28_C0003G0068 [Candidatus Peregrinibacteria bacterium GW2011_GWF2_33_10]|nr:MAG: hypothetical protein UR28_C0003G0068 [Candidatus Peregrinibacteria bacterium GW2011_GWF2_33_10]OGJ44218.1 MAG: hypothetical protein A2263_04560 [Candidatus Peregrinibacteria bacterium RIFOXYA2_FULL_33_21]OGJ46702.1 MAG: hypothetical protein A2272_04820 [Candidatus Peregrinibacteria bacterium RIFOXYA12_FULL_33_12]OGJ51847.1 MAG: hypothetical protein A2307_05225 [Candidatus Peregrinibacteria bacterium RIFOXYB2_FULL_33_20]
MLLKSIALLGLPGVPNLIFGKNSKKYFSMDIFKEVLEEKKYQIDHEETFYWPYEMPLKIKSRNLISLAYYYFAIKNPKSEYSQKILDETFHRIKKLSKKHNQIFIYAHSAGTIIIQRLLLDPRLNEIHVKIFPVLVAVPNQIFYGSKILNRFFGNILMAKDVKQIKTQTVMITGAYDILSSPNVDGSKENLNIKCFTSLRPRTAFEYIPGIQHGALMGKRYKDVYEKILTS